MKAIALVSGGIDSPVAAYLMMKRGAEVYPLLLDLYPFSFEENKMRAVETIKKLKGHARYEFHAYICSHGKNLVEFLNRCPRRLTCILCRRAMFRIAERVAEKKGARALITGEFLGSKATQTLTNLGIVAQAVEIPVLRPLLGLNKEEIEEYARAIGTYEISTKPAMCCTVTPEKPSTRAKLADILAAEANVDMKALVNESLKTLQELKI
ncbi:MAG: hypothetical protein AB1468_01995 [Candidatus Micrarchaeota archaeon]